MRPTDPTPGHFSVLLVDDHHMMRLGLKTLAQASSALAIDWLEAGNLADVLHIYAHPPETNLVLLELNLPDIQGLQVEVADGLVQAQAMASPLGTRLNAVICDFRLRN